jgi:membrane protein required for colicin V production
MTVVDWIIVVILAGSVLAGVAQGFLRSIFSLGGLILGLVMAAWNYDRVARFVQPMLHNEKASNAIGFIVVAFLVAAVCAAVGIVLSKAFKKIGLGCLDSLAGAIFGFFQGALLVTVFILITVAFFPDTEWLTQSRLPRYFFAACHLSTNISPSGLSALVRNDLNRLERESPAWMHPGQRAR